MIDRLIILLAVIVLIASIWGAVRLWSRLKLRGMQEQAPFQGLVPVGKPAVVAFSAPHCRDCHTLQAPALARLRSYLNDRVNVTSVSALDHPDLVHDLGILTVPSTVVIDARGNVRHLNLGYASDIKLREQLVSISSN